MRPIFSLPLVILLVHRSLFVQVPLPDNPLRNHLDSVVHQAAISYLRQPNTVGLSIGVYRLGKRHTYNYGEVKKGTQKLPTAHTFYNVGSVAKTFVGVMLV